MNARTTLRAVAISCVCLSLPAIAYGREWTLGARVGVNIADLAGELSRIEGTESRTTFVAGIAARRSISEVFEIQPEVLYSQKGAKYSFSDGPGQTYHVTEQLDYIDLPILLKIGLPKQASVSPALLLGPSIGFFLTGKLNILRVGPRRTRQSTHSISASSWGSSFRMAPTTASYWTLDIRGA
jgi:hypothetical protein